MPHLKVFFESYFQKNTQVSHRLSALRTHGSGRETLTYWKDLLPMFDQVQLLLHRVNNAPTFKQHVA